ncbi:hypothetical protein C8Q74DRAFT_1249785 [Fomes fomentarius]|nr:hypothetical protein C8Q74DRAFT_1249785 [Fomes fomentarius]
MHHASPCFPAVYPLMRTLLIRHRGRLDPTPYIRAFPNLAHLEVDTQSVLNDDVHESRASNIRSQREIDHLGPASQEFGWRELVQFHGSLVDLYALALNCRISHIILDKCTDDIHLPLLPAVLADARPLHLNIEGLEGILYHPTHSLSAILQTQGASRLESLVVSCSIFNHTPHEDIVSALSSLAASLAMLPGPFRRLRMGIHLDEYRSLPSPEASPEWLTITAANIDVEKIVQNLVESIPTLEDVLFRCSGEARSGGRIMERQATFLRPHAVVKGGSWTDDALDCGMLTLGARYPWFCFRRTLW